MQGARAVQESVLSDFPQADVRVAFVWIDMVAGDSRATADKMAASIRDPRAEHLHDVNKAAGRVIAESLGSAGKVAWDIYLLYPPASRWSDQLPQAIDWAHQLDETEFAGPSRYRSGAALSAKLHEWMEKLVV